MTQAVKKEVVKLGESMTEEQRKELNETLEAVKEAQGKEDTQEEKEDEEDKEKEPCPNCGYSEDRQVPTKEDTEEYMRAILGDRRFTKTYDVMRGRIKIEFTTVDTSASERMNKIISELATLEDPALFRSHLIKLQMVYMLKSYKIGDKAASFDGSDAKTLQEAEAQFTDRFGDLDEGLAGMFTTTLGSFMALKKALIDACFDETFYKGAGPF